MQGKLSVPGRPTIWIIVGQGPIALAVGAVGVVWTFFSLDYHFSFLSPSLGDRGGRVLRWSWVNLQCRGDLHFGLW